MPTRGSWEVWLHTFKSEFAGCVEATCWMSVESCFAAYVYYGTGFAGAEAGEGCADQAVRTEEVGFHLGCCFFISESVMVVSMSLTHCSCCLPQIFHRTQQRVSSIVYQDVNLAVETLRLLEDCRTRSCICDVEFKDFPAFIFDG